MSLLGTVLNRFLGLNELVSTRHLRPSFVFSCSYGWVFLDARPSSASNKCIIRAMPTIDSDGCRPPIPGHADHRFRQHDVQFFRNTGIGGRLELESVDGMLQNPGQPI
jgi:hypothetical protein